MKTHWLLKFLIFILVIFLGMGLLLFVKDLQNHQEQKNTPQSFYLIKGSVEKLIYHHASYPQKLPQAVELKLKNVNAAFFYGGSQKNYQLFIEQVKACREVELLFKKADLLENQRALIWSAKVCGKTILKFNDTILELKAQENSLHFWIKTTLLCILLLIFTIYLYLWLRLSPYAFCAPIGA